MSYQGKQQAVAAWARACPGAGENLVERVVDTAGTVTIYPIVSDTLISDYIDGHELRARTRSSSHVAAQTRSGNWKSGRIGF